MQEYFSHCPLVQAIFLGLCIHLFLTDSHSCCMIFFDCKGFAGNFFLKSSTPSPPQRSNGPDVSIRKKRQKNDINDTNSSVLKKLSCAKVGIT